MSAKISFYPRISETKNGDEVALDLFLGDIQKGTWQDIVLPIRVETDPVKQRELKALTSPYATMSGKFKDRNNNGLVEHSGILAIDVDDLENPETTKDLLRYDNYVYSIFTSIGGKGLCLLFRINPAKHLDSFLGLQEYLFSTYNIIVDPSCKDVSRPRYVSYDPHIYINDRATKFVQYPKKETKAQSKAPEIVFVQTDFDSIVNDIQSRRIDITSGYQPWLKIGFALADKFGEGGRNYFHVVSQQSGAYDPEICDRQYTNCLKSKSHGITIASFYWLVKQAGIETASARTKEISRIAYNAKKASTNQAGAIRTLEILGIEIGDDANDIIKQVFENNIQISEASDIEAAEIWVKENCSLRRNAVTKYIENYGIRLAHPTGFNDVYLKIKRQFPKLSYQDLERIILSSNSPEYNPIIEVIQAESHRTSSGHIDALFDAIHSNTPNYKYFGKKWYVGIVRSIFGQHSSLIVLLTGVQGSGKTELLRRILPDILKPYYGESNLNRGKDDELAMCEHLIISVDDMGEISKPEQIAHIKDISSKDWFLLRVPYGKGNEKFKRLASLCGSTNHTEILFDTTGNRRIIPINVLSIDHAAYNAVDKMGALIEAYHLLKTDFSCDLSKEDIQLLGESAQAFENNSPEKDLILQYYSLPEKQEDGPGIDFLNPTEMRGNLERISFQKLNATKFGQELKNNGWIKRERIVSGKRVKGYYVIDRTGMRPQFPAGGSPPF